MLFWKDIDMARKTEITTLRERLRTVEALAYELVDVLCDLDMSPVHDELIDKADVILTKEKTRAKTTSRKKARSKWTSKA